MAELKKSVQDLIETLKVASEPEEEEKPTEEEEVPEEETPEEEERIETEEKPSEEEEPPPTEEEEPAPEEEEEKPPEEKKKQLLKELKKLKSNVVTPRPSIRIDASRDVDDKLTSNELLKMSWKDIEKRFPKYQ